MNEKQINARVMHKKDTLSNWTINNPILLNGEIILITDDEDNDKLYIKIGDGESNFNDLPLKVIIDFEESIDGGSII